MNLDTDALAKQSVRFVGLLDNHLQLTVDELSKDDYYWATGLALAVYAGFEIYRILPDVFFHWKRDRIPATKEQTLEALSTLDVAYIFFNKMVTVLFTYHMLQYAWNFSLWTVPDARTFLLLPVELFSMYFVYDFFYHCFHRALHIPWLYPLVHKHHHRQHAPFRGNIDAINVHPFEYVVGEYNHLFTYALFTQFHTMHALTALVFIVVGGFYASLNHTRYNVKLSPLWFAVAAHDIHHRLNQTSNYGQYTMLWDYFFGTFVPSPDVFVEEKKAQ